MGSIKTYSPFRVSLQIPDDAYLRDVPLAATIRARHVETLHRGAIEAVSTSGDLIVSAGDSAQATFMRSSAKPFQAMALVLTGAADALDLSTEDLAIASASHSGEGAHIEAAMALLKRAGLGPEKLRCGIHPATSSEAANGLMRSGQEPTALHNNCSGKHAGMLVASFHMGWPLDTYLEPSHPLQQMNLDTISTFTGIPRSEIDLGIDGCGVPTFYVSVAGIATAFAGLATGQGVGAEHAEAALRIRSAMMAHPFLIGGTGRFDTEMMTAAKGGIVCKGGAAGAEGIGLTASGIGIGMKISDGGAGFVLKTIAARLLKGLGELESRSNLQEILDEYERIPIRNHAGTKTGFVVPTFTLTGPDG